jgi:hypothetical protein
MRLVTNAGSNGRADNAGRSEKDQSIDSADTDLWNDRAGWSGQPRFRRVTLLADPRLGMPHAVFDVRSRSGVALRGDSQMKCHFWGLAALALGLIVATLPSPTCAQTRSYARGRTRLAQQTTPVPTPTPTPATREELPGPTPGGMPMPAESYGYEPGYMDGGYGGPGCPDAACCDAPYCGYGCGDSCCDYGCYGSPGCCDGWLGGYCSGGQLFVTADYLYARASFSDAFSHDERNITEDPDRFTDNLRRFDFDYESSYRFGGGYRLPGCNEEIRFLYTRLASSADTFVSSSDVEPTLIFLPFDDTALDNQVAFMHALVKIQAYDLEFAKTIPLGGNCGGDCCQPCGGCGCPPWDITWSGGFRFSQADWDRFYLVGDGETADSQYRSAMNFQGGGPRVGLEGRRYWGQGGWISVYLKGNISLLFGNVDLTTQMTQIIEPNDPDSDIITTQIKSDRQFVPVTEIEAGLTAHITRSTTMSFGYLFSAWHDLGFRDENLTFVPALDTHYDDANLLGFDSFFARLEVGF